MKKFLYLILALSVSPVAISAHHEEDSLKESGKNPFILIARIQVKEGMVDEYLEIANSVDNAVEASEPGMLFHNFDSDPEDPLAFTWTEVYSNSKAFIKHDANPPVQEYVTKHAELADGFTIEVYGNVSQEVIDTINRLGIPLKHFKTTKVGYVRAKNFIE
jgi:quinol monooxygenase YgiN|tara:strand:- start:1168 stop:1650 length:483 start_codon:yes stop_codon:yes gene_type:complete